MNEIENQTSGWTYVGLSTVTFGLLMFEILLTRVFSVTMFYHFAFVAISIAMFGLTVGSLAVFILPGVFYPAGAKRQLAVSAMAAAVLVITCFVIHLRIPFYEAASSSVQLHLVALIFIVVAVPFIFLGIVVCLALTRFPRKIGRLYAADLVGAALGCLGLIAVLDWTDAATAVLVVGLMVAAGAACFARDGRWRFGLGWALILVLLLGVLTGWHSWRVRQGRPLIRITMVKGVTEQPLLYEKWNSFSRVDVTGNPNEIKNPFGWGLSRNCPPQLRARELMVRIDAAAGTVLTGFDGDLSKVEYLKYDLTNLVHWLRPNARVAIIGAGGGRDVLSALAFDQREVWGIEMNENVLGALNGRFGSFTGHLDCHPRVKFVNDEARSWLARGGAPFDIIQVSMIDTWAATAAGAYVLAENSLYSMEAWDVFLNRLSPRGVLTFTRWFQSDRPDEMYRLLALASAVLARRGAAEPYHHLLMAGRLFPLTNAGKGGAAPLGVGTLLVGREPFSEQDQVTMRETCTRLGFEPVLVGGASPDPIFARLAMGRDLAAFTRQFPVNITPPTDDSPFFFNMLWPRDVFKRPDTAALNFNQRAVALLGKLLLTVVGLTTLCIILPLALRSPRGASRGGRPFFVFFTGIGLGFMLVEIAQMQRLILFLGHPTYGLSVVLFSLLASSGLGSLFSQRLAERERRRGGWICLAGLAVLLSLLGLVTPVLSHAFQGGPTFLRVVIAMGIIAPAGFFMGTMFPVGMRVVADRSAQLMPWMLGLNGAMSVCASVVAIAVSMAAGITVTFWAGVGCYALAGLAYWGMPVKQVA